MISKTLSFLLNFQYVFHNFNLYILANQDMVLLCGLEPIVWKKIRFLKQRKFLSHHKLEQFRPINPNIARGKFLESFHFLDKNWGSNGHIEPCWRFLWGLVFKDIIFLCVNNLIFSNIHLKIFNFFWIWSWTNLIEWPGGQVTVVSDWSTPFFGQTLSL